MTEEVYIISAARTPIGCFNGSLAQISATRLGSIVIEDVVKRAGMASGEVDSVVMGVVLSAGLGQAPARQAAIGAGLSTTVRTAAVNSLGGSAMTSMIFAAEAIAAGSMDVAVAGGMENMSRAQYLLDKARFGYRLGGGEVTDSIIKDLLWDVYNDMHVGDAAEVFARQYALSRAEQDRYARESFSRALRAQKNGDFEKESTQIMIPVGQDKFASVAMDEGPQRHGDRRIENLPPLFRDDGTVTSGNSAAVSDGAAAVALASARAVKRLGVAPLARFAGSATGGSGPEHAPATVAGAVDRLLKQAGLKTQDVDLFEINEDYAALALAVRSELKLDPDRVNVCGGNLALGNPAGAAGARITATLLHSMERAGVKRGVAAVNCWAGEAVAVLVERD